MTAADLSRAITESFGGAFICSEHNAHQRVRTPFLYPDGDHIDLFVKMGSDDVLVTDLAETTRWLRARSVAQKRSLKQNQLIHDVVRTHSVEFSRGMLQARCASERNLADVLVRVAQAALSVSDLWFTFRTRSVTSITDEVADFLIDRGVSFTRSPKLPGRSGRQWTLDFRVPEEKPRCLVNLLSTGNRAAARQMTEHVLASWWDLSHLASGTEALRFISLFDDSVDIWKEEDFTLVKGDGLSEIAYWSRPDGLLDWLQAKA